MTKHEQDLVKMICKLKQGKRDRLKQVSNTTIDEHYERFDKKYGRE